MESELVTYSAGGQIEERSGLRALGQCPQPRALSPQHASRGQATLEMMVSFVCAFLLLLVSIKLFLWFAERFVTRQKNYEATRVEAATTTVGSKWEEPSDRLKLFPKQP